jgi:hypothetical protein
VTRRPAAVLAAVLTGVLAPAGTAAAADHAVQSAGSVQGVLGQASQQASQATQQASQTAQGAAAQANAGQSNPVNVAVQIIVNSPGASPVIVQNNSNGSGAHASNQSSTHQNSHAAQSGGGGGGGGSVQGVQQAGTTVQGAGSQAKAAQANPVNIAVQVVKDSPGASPVIVQTNGNAAGAKAENAAATSQGALASQAGSGSRAGRPSSAPAHPAAASLSPPKPPPSGGSGADLEALLGGFPDLAWVWKSLAADLRPLPTVPGWVLSPAGWPLPRFDGRAAAPGEARGAAGHGSRPAKARRGAHPAGALGEVVDGTPIAPGSVSSSFVQTPANQPKDSHRPTPQLPLPGLPAPAGGGAAPVPTGLILAVAAALALFLSSLGLLLGRLGLASARWRHQAYLAPLQRPG